MVVLFTLSISEVCKQIKQNFSWLCCLFFQIIRDATGAPDVLTRLEGPQPNPIDGIFVTLNHWNGFISIYE
jgi:hypothetical protein